VDCIRVNGERRPVKNKLLDCRNFLAVFADNSAKMQEPDPTTYWYHWIYRFFCRKITAGNSGEFQNPLIFQSDMQFSKSGADVGYRVWISESRRPRNRRYYTSKRDA
jgi:phosphatidylserine decarboxylase